MRHVPFFLIVAVGSLLDVRRDEELDLEDSTAQVAQGGRAFEQRLAQVGLLDSQCALPGLSSASSAATAAANLSSVGLSSSADPSRSRSTRGAPASCSGTERMPATC